MSGVEVWWDGNSMQVRLLGLKDLALDTYISSGYTVECEVKRASDDSTLTTVTLSAESDASSTGNWSGTATGDLSLTIGEELDLVFTADGGSNKKRAKWVRRVEVQER